MKYQPGLDIAIVAAEELFNNETSSRISKRLIRMGTLSSAERNAEK
jgi:hypothetical protein